MPTLANHKLVKESEDVLYNDVLKYIRSFKTKNDSHLGSPFL